MQYMQPLVGNLNKVCKRALEEAAELCVSSTHFTVDIEHLLLRLCDKQSTDLNVIFKYYEVDERHLRQELKAAVEKFKRGNNKTPALSPHLLKLLERAWLMSSLHLKQHQIRSGAIIHSLLKTEELLGVVMTSCPSLLKIPRGKLEEDIFELIKASPEQVDITFVPGDGVLEVSKHVASTEALDRFTWDITKHAKEGKIDPITGRDSEIRQMIDVLTRRRQNNPILTGDAGVGKTAVVEGLALRIASGDVPPALKNVTLRALDLGLLQAGAGIKGEFENRLKTVIKECQASVNPTIVFIDEAHTMIGSGGNQGENDAANLLKPALARGELRTIAATTWNEYKKYFEKDPALSRRFQVVKIEEPSPVVATQMLRGITEKLENHHKVFIQDAAIHDAVRLSTRYLTGRKLPDKAVSVLDTACARVALAQNSVPEKMEEILRQITNFESEKALLEKDTFVDQKVRIQDIDGSLVNLKKDLGDHQIRWEDELKLVKDILALRQELLEEKKKGNHFHASHQHILDLKKQLDEKQKEFAMVSLYVDGNVVASVISDWTGIPLGKMVRDEVDTVLKLPEIMGKKLIGQTQAVESIAKHILTYRANLDEPNKPVGVFLLVGPSGVGKTETAITLADTLYGGEKNLIVINMSEYQEAHTVSLLKGAPPGYVGYGKGGVLTEAVRRHPYSVVLLDEIEKAHPDVMELFYQVFDKGMMEDAEGVEVNFKNTVILMTSNLGADVSVEAHEKNKKITPENLIKKIRPILSKHFKPALLGRMVVVPYYPLNDKELRQIIDLKMQKVVKRFATTHRADLKYDKSVVDHMVERCNDPDSGARNIDYILNQNLLPLISTKVLHCITQEKPVHSMEIKIARDGQFTCTAV
jgi:type VI secretion system protein VasG